MPRTKQLRLDPPGSTDPAPETGLGSSDEPGDDYDEDRAPSAMRLINAHNDGLLLGEQRAAARYERQIATLRDEHQAALIAFTDRAWQAGYQAAMDELRQTATPRLDRTNQQVGTVISA